jgi:hypothetical protein
VRSAEDVEIEVLKKDSEDQERRIEKLEARLGVIETAIAWLIGAAVGVGALAGAIKSGILKALAS